MNEVSKEDLDYPGFLIRRLQQISVMLFLERLGPLGITPSQFTVLRIIQADPDLDQVTIAKKAFLDVTSVTDIIARLEQKGAIARVANIADRRKRQVRVTDHGAALLAAAGPLVSATRQDLLSILPPDERQTLLELISRVVSEHSRQILGGHAQKPWTRTR